MAVRHALTLEEKKQLDWYIQQVLWLKDRAAANEQDAVEKLDAAVMNRNRLERSIKDRLGIAWTETLVFSGGDAYVGKP